ncbi:MAG: hypothetical protein ACP6IY_12355 [Promethearchaeia archaeon]
MAALGAILPYNELLSGLEMTIIGPNTSNLILTSTILMISVDCGFILTKFEDSLYEDSKNGGNNYLKIKEMICVLPERVF